MPDYLVRLDGQPPILLARSRPELTLGRAEDQDFSIDDPTISRCHARLTWREGVAWLEDLGSRHGSFKNGVRLKAPEVITPRDRITLSQRVLTLEAVPESVPAQGTPAAAPLSVPLDELRQWQLGGDPTLFSKWKEALDLLHALSLELLKDLEPERLLGNLLDRLFAFLEANRGAILMRNEAGNLALLAVRTRERTVVGPLNFSPAALEATLSRRAAMVFHAPVTPPSPGQQGRLTESDTTSTMAMPLEHAGQVLGLFYFDASPQRGPFTELDLRFVASLSNLAAAKILAQRVAEELRRKQELEKELQAREAAAQAKGEFLALMSHEIRNPMNIVLGFTRLARKEALPPKLADYLKEIDHSGRSLMRLVNDILDYSKMEAGKLALEAIPFRPDAIVQQVLDQFAPAAAEKGLVLSQGHGGPGAEEPARAGAGPELLGDPLRLGQILTNLVGNAIKFTNEGTVQVDVHDGGNVAGRVQVRFSVRDTGIGIAPAQLARLFMPYTQAEASTSRQFGGTGLGLAISKRLVEMMGGILTAESQGPGSTFSFTLDLEAAPAPAAGLEAPASRTPCLTSRHLLLVEDNVPNQKLVRALLAETGARVSLAVTGSEALQRLADVAFDAVLIDLHLPDLDGVAITRRLRAEGRTLPVIAMTANTREERWDACLAAGMNDFVAKPIEPNLLFAALARCVPESAPDLPGPETGGPARAPLDQQVLDALTELMDVPRALDLVDGRAELLVGFLRDYLDHPLQPGAIAAAMARDDHEEAYRLSHDLKGIAGMLAMPAVAGACVEVLNHLGGRETGDWRSACGRIDEYMAPFLARARQALASADLIP